MVGHGFMFGEQYKTMVLGLGDTPSVEGGEEEFARLLSLYAAEADSRFRLLSPDGEVLFDTAAEPEIGADLSDLKEITKAETREYGARWELTEDRQYVFYYTALPIMHEDELVGIAYVSRHTGEITRAIMGMIRDQRLALASAIVFAALIALVLAQTLTHRLRKLTKSSINYAAGNAPLDVKVRGRDEIGELGRAVTYMAREIEQRNEYNRVFVSTVMHELKTPITAIKGAAEVLEGGAVDKEEARAKFLANIRYEADRLTRMVGELNELTKLDVEMLRGQKEEVDYCDCVRKILERLIPTFEQKRATFTASIPEEKIAAMIMPGRIEQVIANLLENAFRYTPATGTVELKVELGPDNDVLTSVSDTGPGISGSNIDKVFDRFFTTEPKDTPKEYGSGLGLAIAKSIVENHQGRIRAASTPGEGACFTFGLPIL
jgi:two-component system sensor histidine kinase ChvG